MTTRGAATTLAVPEVSGTIRADKEAEMVKSLVAIAMLVGIVAVAAVGCGGGDDEEAASPPPAAAAAPASGPGASQPVGITRQEGNVIDFMLILSEGTSPTTVLGYLTEAGFEPKDMVFKVGQTVNFTVQNSNPDARSKHTFTVFRLGINEAIKYGQPTRFTFTFDKPGRFPYYSATDSQATGTITVE